MWIAREGRGWELIVLPRYRISVCCFGERKVRRYAPCDCMRVHVILLSYTCRRMGWAKFVISHLV